MRRRRPLVSMVPQRVHRLTPALNVEKQGFARQDPGWYLATPVAMKTFQVSVENRQLKIECGAAVLDGPIVTELLAEVKTALRGVDVTHVLVITNGLTDCTETAKKQLVELQREFASKVRRSAWVDERARFRGIALWVMHLAGDPRGRDRRLDTRHRGVATLARREHPARCGPGGGCGSRPDQPLRRPVGARRDDRARSRRPGGAVVGGHRRGPRSRCRLPRSRPSRSRTSCHRPSCRPRARRATDR